MFIENKCQLGGPSNAIEKGNNPGGTPHMKGAGMLVGNFELNPKGDRSGVAQAFF